MESRSFIPTSIFQCFSSTDERILDPIKYFLFKRSQREELERNDLLTIIAACEAEADAESALQKANKSAAPRKRQCREDRLTRDRTTGELREFVYTDTWWYRNYVQSPNLNSKRFAKKFRRRFRCRYNSFQNLLKQVKDSALFRCWGEEARNCAGGKPVPIELLVLGALRYIGRGWCLDDLEEQTCISEETHRRFIHVFIAWGSTTFYEKYVRLPKDATEAMEWSSEYSRAGLPGCLSSGDATHVGMLKCQYKLKQYNMSFKLEMPSRTYNIHVTHRRRILSTTSGHPARWNDKTLQLFDEYAKLMRDGKLMRGFTFTLLEEDENQVIHEVKYSDPWEIVDNGYLRWSTMIPPSKYYATYSEMRFSKWLESLRKDVEW